MKAIEFAAFGRPAEMARLVERPDPPPPGPGEVLVETLLATINPADLLTIEGRYGVRPRLPAIPGAEAVGRIGALGEGVAGLAVGDAVLILSGATWRDRTVLKAGAVVRLPPGIDLEQAAMIKANPATAAAMITGILPLAAGDWLIQNAANSAAGRFVVQLARRRGIRTVNVVRRQDAVADLQRLGADVILVDDGRDAARLARDVAAATGGEPIRLALDAVGGGATDGLAASLAEGGVIANYGLLSGVPCQVDPFHLVFRGIRLQGFWLAQYAKAQGAAAMQALFAELIELVARGEIRAEVEARYPFARIAEALDHAARPGRSGKILLTP